MKKFWDSTLMQFPKVVGMFFIGFIGEVFAFIARNLIISMAAVAFIMGKIPEGIVLVVFAFYCVIREVMEAVDDQTDLLKQIFKVKEEE